MDVEHDLMRRAGRGLLRAAVLSLVAVALGQVGTAMAETPDVTIASPSNGSVTNNPTPTFSGLAEQGYGEVTLAIYSGAPVNGQPNGPPLQTTKTSVPPFPEAWKIASAHLADGTYTAQATQGGEQSIPVTFTVDTTPPHLTLSSPVNGSSTGTGSLPVSGTAGTEVGDLQTVTIRLFAGPSIGTQAALEALTVSVSNGSWSGIFGGLTPGTYTARAEQSDWAGNIGISVPVTFTVSVPAGPAASFRWFPAVPHTGETVSLVSSSTDTASPITAFAWALTGTGPFQAGKPVLTTSFSTRGSHVVRLLVTNADGLSSVATETIKVVGPTASLMQPFPVVRIAGTETASGVKVRLLKVQQVPAGAQITVRCKGRGCPIKAAKRVAVSSKREVAPVEFRAFERSLRFGVTLEILVSKRGEIGKYTRFVIRRGKLPERVDMCLDLAGSKPIVCPSS